MNTPTDAYFALDPNYLARQARTITASARWPSAASLADAIKDTAVVTQVPELGPVWERQVEAQRGWTHFQLADFERLKAEFGVNWVLVAYPAAGGASLPVAQRQLFRSARIPVIIHGA